MAFAGQAHLDGWQTVGFHGGVQTAEGKKPYGDPLEISLREKGKAKDVAEGLELLTGYRFDPGKCGDHELGPLDDGVLRSGREFWLALIAPFTKIVRVRERVNNLPSIVNNLQYGEGIHDFSIERGNRIQVLGAISRQLEQQLGMEPHEGIAGEMDMQVGPIQGRMSVNDALRMVIQNDDFIIRWGDNGMNWVSIEPAVRETVYADMSESECSFGLKELGRVTVTEPRLYSLQDAVASPVEVFDRERIERSGVASIPELLRYATQTAFTRAPGYRLNGAQYAEGRGVGPAMVLIEGQRTMASVSSLEYSAFDLNTIPLSAVERIEIMPDGASIVHGVDSVGGIVNIVLRRPNEELSSEARYGGARGGAIERRLTALVRMEGPGRDATLIADQLEVTALPGHTRSRYANQDYTRYTGGIDRRSLSSEQGNLQSIDGQDIPGFGSPIVGLPSPESREFLEASDLSEQPNLTSLLRYQSVSQARQRASLVAVGSLDFDIVNLTGNAIYTRQTTEYAMPPPSVSGLLVATDHPQNPLNQPLLYYGLLTGIPSQQFGSSNDVFRSAASMRSRALGWAVELSLAHTEDRYTSVLTNSADPVAVAESLNSSNAETALHFFAHAPGAGRTDLMVGPATEKYAARGSYAHLVAEKEFAIFPAGDTRVQIGADWRNEEIGSDLVVGAPTRNALGNFLNVGVPVLRSLSFSAGARQDRYSDGDSVTSSQVGFEWKPSEYLKVNGHFGERYRPPSLFELNMAALPFDIPIADPKTGQTAIATVVAGGRRDLKPTTAQSVGLGFSLTTEKQLEISLGYWQVKVEDRISPLSLVSTLRYEDYLPGRVIRGPSQAEGVPGQIRVVDISWKNLGEIEASGVDIKVRKEWTALGGRLESELGATWNAKYSYRDLPEEVSPLSDRVGVASQLGTVLRHRAVAHIGWESSAWRIAANVSEYPSYSDQHALQQTSFRVHSQTLVDLNVSRRWGSSSLTIGAINSFNTEPGYANVSVWGYDPSQGDLRGRFLYGEVKIGF